MDTERRFESRGQSGSVLTKGYRGYNKLCYRVHLLTNLLLRSREERVEIRRQTNKLPSSISLPPEVIDHEKCCFLDCSLFVEEVTKTEND